MANPYRKLRAHSPVTAFSITAWNRLMDMLDWWMMKQSHSGGKPLKNLVDWNQTFFRVKNATGYGLASYDPIGLDGPIFDPATGGEPELKNQTSQKGSEPTVADHAGGKWGVMLEAAANGKIGRCCMVGVVPVRVYVNGTADKYVDVIAAETVGEGEEAETVYLGTGSSGAQILWRGNEGSGAGTIVWAIVRLGQADPGIRFRNKSTGSVTIPAYGVAVVSENTSVDYLELAIPKVNTGFLISPYRLYVNGPSAVAYNDYGHCQAAKERPVLALVKTFSVSLFTLSRSWGLVPSATDFTLWPFLPGFTIVSSAGPTAGVQYVVANPWQTCWAKASADWVNDGSCPYVYARPCSYNGAYVYDGGTYGGVTFPALNYLIRLPRNGSNRDPNIHTGDIFRYGPGDTCKPTQAEDPFVGCGGYLDDKIGSVKFWNGTVANIPSGWSQIGVVTPTLMAACNLDTENGLGGTITYGTGEDTISYTQYVLIQRTS